MKRRLVAALIAGASFATPLALPSGAYAQRTTFKQAPALLSSSGVFDSVWYPSWIPPSVRGHRLDLAIDAEYVTYDVQITGRRAASGPTFLGFGRFDSSIGEAKSNCVNRGSSWRHWRSNHQAIYGCWGDVSRTTFARRSGGLYYAGSKYYGRITDAQLVKIVAHLRRV